MARAAVVEVASAVEVAMYRELPMERNVHALLDDVVSTSANCGPVEEATVSDHDGVVVPMPTLPALSILIRSVSTEVAASLPVENAKKVGTRFVATVPDTPTSIEAISR